MRMTTSESVLRRIVRKNVEKLLTTTINEGSMIVETPGGTRFIAGDGSRPQVIVRVTTWSALTKIMLYPDLAIGEAYMDGTLIFEKGDIYDFLDIIFTNLKVDEPPGISRITRAIVGLLRRVGGYNSLKRSRRNVAHHYDLDGRLYELFLDRDRQYSCAYFESAEKGLDDAQLAKKRHLAAKLDLHEGQRVLDIGSGWGGLALYLARVAGVNVRGITLSTEQLAVSLDRAAADGMEDKVQFDLQDYRRLESQYDRIVSVGMFEHVGRKSYREFFTSLNGLLKNDGVAVLHYIGRATVPYETNPWVLKYIFPGGYMPSLSEVLPEIERQNLIVTDIEVLRLHYAETLRHWRERFLANRDKAVRLYDERFARMWEFYLAACETAFRYQGLVIHQIQIAKSVTSLPLTRDYMLEDENKLREHEDHQSMAAQ